MSKQAEFAAKAFSMVTLAHQEHFRAGSYAAHIALEKLYEALPDLIDSFVEHYQGLYGKIPAYPAPWTPGSKDIIAVIQLLVDWIAENRAAITTKNVTLENDIADILGELYRALYRLKELK